MAFLLVGLAGCVQKEAVKAQESAPKIVRAEVQTVAETKEAGSYVASGTVKARLNATLASKVMGRVVSIAVVEGDPITKGQLLVSLDSRELQAGVKVAAAGYHGALVGVDNASTSAQMETQTSRARIAQAESQVSQARAALASAEARRDLTLAGPRTQEVSQSHLAVVQTESSVQLAKRELERTAKLVEEGALARRELDLAQNRYDVAKGQFDFAIQTESMAREGSRTQEIRAARDAVTQATGALKQAQAVVAQARAAAMLIAVRRKEVEVAKAQVQEASATMQSAQVSLSYAQVPAPFDGRVVQRLVDPGSMASPGVSLLEVEGGEYRLEAVVPENILRSASVGVFADVRIEALSGQALSGRIVEVVPKADAATHSFIVKIALPKNRSIKSGMYGKVTIRTGSVTRTLIPQSATWEREGLSYVFALNAEGIARIRIVTLGERHDDKIEVLSGLTVGDRIVIGNRDAVSDGCKVEPR